MSTKERLVIKSMEDINEAAVGKGQRGGRTWSSRSTTRSAWRPRRSSAGGFTLYNDELVGRKEEDAIFAMHDKWMGKLRREMRDTDEMIGKVKAKLEGDVPHLGPPMASARPWLAKDRVPGHIPSSPVAARNAYEDSYRDGR